MTSRLIALITMLMLLTGAPAHDTWYDTPLTVPPGRNVIGQLPPNVSEATIHLRFACQPGQQTTLWLIWNDENADNFTRFTLTVPRRDMAEYIFSDAPTVRVDNVADAAATTLYESKLQSGFDLEGDFNSLKLVYEDGLATLYCGNSDALELCQVPMSRSGGAVSFATDRTVMCQRIQCDYKADTPIGMSRFADINALNAYLQQSQDQAEGLWEYLDRKTDADKAVLGGYYAIATVRYGDGYDIIYLKGADVNKHRWKPMMIKGRLKPTIFQGNYDMEWIDAHGNNVSEDVNAQLSDDGATLTLRFPTIGAEVRFRRLKR